MNTLLLIHGPNLNNLGKRAHEHYGTLTLRDLETAVTAHALSKGFKTLCFQSNHEGALIDFLQQTPAQAIIINAGAFTHYSYALFDALNDSALPCIEVHLSDIASREPWRSHSVIAPACVHRIYGKKIEGYIEAVDLLSERLHHAP